MGGKLIYKPCGVCYDKEYIKRIDSLSPRQVAGGMGCKAPRVGHCEAAIADKSEYLKAVGVSAGTGNKPRATGTLPAPPDSLRP